jgi:casein kinase II subunit alpha
MGRVATPSVARIYPDVNAKLGPSWHEYGELVAIQSSLRSFLFFPPDNLQVQWGSQDHYEIVRKVGRGKYSEVRFFCI